MDIADAREPFRCPAQECRNGQLGTDFGDTKHFYRHWHDTHQPRCPRTDCKFNKQKLSKTTESYFLRHWGSHHPALITRKSTCGNCGQEFQNASNRDRHARKCNGSSATTAGCTQQDVGHSCANHIIPTLDATTALGDGLNDSLPECDALNAPSFVQAVTQTALVNIPEWPSSWTADASNPCVSPLPLTNDYTNAATTSTQHMLSASFDWLFGSDTVHVSEQQNSVGTWNLQHTTDFDVAHQLSNTLVHRVGPQDYEATNDMYLMHDTDPRPQTDKSQKDKSDSLWPSLDSFGLSTLDDPGAVVNQQTRGLDCRMIDNLPMRILRQYKDISNRTRWFEHPQWVEKGSKSVIKYKQVVSIKSFVPSRTGYREVSRDQQIWIHKIVRKIGRNGPKIIETSTSIVNNVLNSKTKYPRVIDDDSPVWHLCVTGQYDEVNRLLSQNVVTVFDVDSAGMTLLHVAAGYWQLDICRLLLAKGADVEAREWGCGLTPFRFTCIATYKWLDYSNNDLADVLALMVQNGTDVCAEIELGYCLTFLAVKLKKLDATTPWSEKHKLSRAFSWLLRMHRLETTCDGVVPNVALTGLICSALSESGMLNADMDDVWNLERSDCQIFMPKDTQAIQSFWLWLIQEGDLCGPPRGQTTLSSDFYTMYRTDFHYQGLLQYTSEEKTTPLQVALRSFHSFVTFHCILLVAGTDPKAFAATESTMPWCIYTQKTLENLFSVDFDAYEKLKPLFERPGSCHSPQCFQDFQSDGILDWDEVIALVRAGRSLVSLLKFPSEEEEQRLHLAYYYCEDCRSKMAGGSESYDRRSRLGGRDDECAGFIEGEVVESLDGDEQVSTGDEREAVDDQALYDESLSSEDSSDEEF